MSSIDVPRQRGVPAEEGTRDSATENPPEALLRQVRARRRVAKARRAALLRSLTLLRSSGYTRQP